MNAPSRSPPAGVSRKAQALAYITDRLIEGRSPTMNEIADALGVSETRAKTLVHQLAQEKAIVRQPGSQRAISVPGLQRQQMVEQLRAEGWLIVEGSKMAFPAQGCPKEHLTVISELDHIPDDFPEIDDDERDHDRTRTAAGNAPGARPTAAEGENQRAA